MKQFKAVVLASLSVKAFTQSVHAQSLGVDKMSMDKVRMWVVVSILLMSLCITAQAASVIDDYNKALKAMWVIEPLDEALFGEQINLLDGSAEFKITDVSIPTNSSIPITIGRMLSIGEQTADEYGGASNTQSVFGGLWNLDVPYMHGVFDARQGWVGANRCSAGATLESMYGIGSFYNILYYPEDFRSGININIPGYGSEQYLRLPAGRSNPSDGISYRGGTASHWRISCLESIKNGTGEGFRVLLPDGTKYFFDWMVSRPTTSIIDSTCGGDAGFYRSPNSTREFFTTCIVGVAIPRHEIFLYATEATDKFGNKVSYNFDPDNPMRLTSVSYNDEVVATMEYSSQRLSKITSGTRVWRYEYEGSLKDVVLPDGSRWSYAYSNNMWDINRYLPRDVWSNCVVNVGTKTTAVSPGVGETSFMTISSPSGATGRFDFRRILHGTRQGESYCSYVNMIQGNPVGPIVTSPTAYQVASLFKKTIAGPGLGTLEWNYSYHPGWLAPYESRTKIIDSDGVNTTYTFSVDASKHYGKLLETEVAKAGVILSKTKNVYLLSAVGQAFPNEAGYPLVYAGWGASHHVNRPLIETTTLQDGRIFQWKVATGCPAAGVYCFDIYGRPTKIEKSSRLPP